MGIDPYAIVTDDVRDLKWEDFSAPGIFKSVRNISRFRFIAKLGYAARWQENDEEPRRTAQALYYHLLGTLSSAGFHQTQDLDLYYQEGKIRIHYKDPEYGFSLTFMETGWVEVERAGSSLARFHEWYVRIMPAMQITIDTIKTSIKEGIPSSAGTQRGDMDNSDRLTLQQAQYEFEFVAYNFRKSHSRDRSANLELMKRAFVLLPDERGRLDRSENQDPTAFGRIDYTVNRWVGPEEARRREGYKVSAPSNNEWSSLWFTFGYIGDSYISPEGHRSPFNDKDFVTARGAVAPYVHFLRDRAIRGFMETLTAGYEFSTTPDTLP